MHLPCMGATQSNQNSFTVLFEFFKHESKNENSVLPKAVHFHAFERPFFRFKKGVILTPG